MILQKVFSSLLILFVSLGSCAQLRYAKKMEIKAVGFSIQTFSSIDCSNFEKLMGSSIISKQIFGRDTIENFQDIVNKSKKADKEINVNVRAKIYLYDHNNVLLCMLCMDKFGNIILNGESIRKNEELVSLIKKYLPEEIL